MVSKVCAVLSATAALCLAPGTSLAAETEGDGPVVEELVVTARKIQENQQNVPLAISVFSADFIADRGLASVSEIAEFTPNLSYAAGPSGSGRATNFFIRGIGQPDFISTLEPGVGLYLDGVYLGGLTGTLLDLADVERVEVLRGPQGTLFGKNTIGGAVQVVSIRPGKEREGSFELTAGRFNRFDARFAYNLPLSETLATRISGSFKSNDGHARRIDTGEPAGDDQDVGGRIQLFWTPSERLSILASADATKRRAHPVAHSAIDGTTGYAPIPGDLSEDLAVGVDDWADDLDLFGSSLLVDLELDGFNIKSISSYRTMDLYVTTDFDGTPLPINEIKFDSSTDQLSQELQFIGKSFADRLEWVLGLYFMEERFDFTNINISTIDIVRQKTTNYAAFAHAVLNITDRLSLSAGVRYTREKKNAVLEAPLFADAGRTANLKFNDLTPKISIDYKATKDVLLYAVYSEGFKSGGVNGRIVPVALSTDTFGAEKVKAYEAGFKSELFGRRIRLNGAGFFTKYADLQTVTVAADPVTGSFFFPIANVGNLDVYGFELELSAAVSDALRINGNLGYTDEKVTKVLPTGIPGIFDRDTELPGAPTWNAAAGFQYAMPTGGQGLLDGEVVFKGDWNYRSQQRFLTLTDPLATQKGYSLFNARITFAHATEGWELALWGKNLSDKRYTTFRQNLGGFNMAVFGRPLEWGVTFRSRF